VIRYVVQRLDKKGTRTIVDSFNAMNDADAVAVARLTFEQLPHAELELLTARKRLVTKRVETMGGNA